MTLAYICKWTRGFAKAAQASSALTNACWRATPVATCAGVRLQLGTRGLQKFLWLRTHACICWRFVLCVTEISQRHCFVEKCAAACVVVHRHAATLVLQHNRCEHGNPSGSLCALELASTWCMRF
eukprot:6198177-Pleurochrysis_carterae.AAC.3